MDTISSFAKTFSSEESLAHAGTRRLSRPVLLRCSTGSCKLSEGSLAEVMVCASSAAMALAFDAGGSSRQRSIWVGDLTKEEAGELLTHYGHSDKTDEFLGACPLAALFDVVCCQSPSPVLVLALMFRWPQRFGVGRCLRALRQRWAWGQEGGDGEEGPKGGAALQGAMQYRK